MAGLLVSVRNACEATRAVAGGAAIIDIKEPLNGALGAASSQTWAEITKTCPSNRPVSIALGELTELGFEERMVKVPSVSFAKIGLANCHLGFDWIPRWRRAIEQLPTGTRPVAVVYSDSKRAGSPPATEIIRRAEEVGCRAVLWDTFDKKNGNLLAHATLGQLEEQIALARNLRMMVVLAGSICAKDLSTIGHLAPDYIAVRGAVCYGSRTGPIDERLVNELAREVEEL